jgi:hypothetical protein
MANYVSLGRSNYFKVNDIENFKELMNELGLDYYEKEGRFAFSTWSRDDGFPSYVYDEATEEEHEIGMIDEVGKYLCDGEVCIYQQIGNEKIRYLDFYSVAFNNKGEWKQIWSDDIYRLAREKFGEEASITEASY